MAAYEAGTVLWTAGVTTPSVATAIAKATGATQDRAERIEVGPDRSIPAPRNPRHRRRDLRRERTFTVKEVGVRDVYEGSIIAPTFTTTARADP